MDSSSPDANTTVFCSPDTEPESSKVEKIKTTVSVSSLAEKFEKSGDFAKSEEKNVGNGSLSKADVEGNMSITENNHESKSNIPENSTSKHSSIMKDDSNSTTEGENKAISPASTNNGVAEGNGEMKNNSYGEDKTVTGISVSKDSVTEDIASKENSLKGQLPKLSALCSKNLNDSTTVKNTIDGGSQQPSTSKNDVDNRSQMSDDSWNPINEEITKAVEEKVASLAEKLSKTYANSTVKRNSDAAGGENTSKSSTGISLKQMEQSFLDALHMTDKQISENVPAEMLAVPSIEITEASDREDTSSEDAEDKSKTSMVNQEKPNIKADNSSGHMPSTSSGSTNDVEKESDASPEERKAKFYISSSDLPAEQPMLSSEKSEPLQKSENIGSLASVRTQESNRARRPFWLFSKSVHGALLLVSFVVTILGFILYNLAHEHKVPDFYEYIGLVTSIISGIIGAFSFFCFTCLNKFPGLERTGYRVIDERTSPVRIENVAGILDDSCSSKKKRPSEKPNGMSISDIASMESDCEEYKEKADKMEKCMSELCKSFKSMVDEWKSKKLIESGVCKSTKTI